MIGTTVVSEIAKFTDIDVITAVDVRQESIDKCLEIANNPKVVGLATSLETIEDIAKRIRRCRCSGCMSSTFAKPYRNKSGNLIQMSFSGPCRIQVQ